MVLHVTFRDGSNPWLSLSGDRHTIAKQWRRWMKYHPETAQPEAHIYPWKCAESFDGGYYVVNINQWGDTYRFYKTLGHALAALDRLGGGSK